MGVKDQLNNKAKAMTTGEKGKAKPKTLYDQIKLMIPEMSKALPAHFDAERMGRIIVTILRTNPALMKCDPASFFGSVMTACQLGLELGPLGLAYLIPYKGQVTLQLGYRGLLELVDRSGRVDTVYAYPVYGGDEFRYSLGSKPEIIHNPCGESDPDKLTHVYAIAWLKDCAFPRIEVMSRQQVEAIRDRSSSVASGKSSPWNTDFVEMARKTVLKRVTKTLPMSTEIRSAIAKDETIRRDIHSEEFQSIFELDDGPEKSDEPPSNALPEANPSQKREKAPPVAPEAEPFPEAKESDSLL